MSLLYSNIFLYIFIFMGGRVECRICKWKLLFFDRTFVAAFAKLTSFRDVGSIRHLRKISFVASFLSMMRKLQ